MIAHRADVEWCSKNAELDVNAFRSAHSWAGEEKTQTQLKYTENTTKIQLKYMSTVKCISDTTKIHLEYN